jgi:hypothetical protein
MGGKQFVTNGDMQKAVFSWLMAFDIEFFHTKIDSLMSQWRMFKGLGQLCGKVMCTKAFLCAIHASMLE